MAASYTPPTADELKTARERADLTQAQAADLVGVHVRSWQRWELGERKMPQPAWRLFLALTKQSR